MLQTLIALEQLAILKRVCSELHLQETDLNLLFVKSV